MVGMMGCGRAYNSMSPNPHVYYEFIVVHVFPISKIQSRIGISI